MRENCGAGMNGKLSREQRRLILALFALGAKTKHVGTLFGVSRRAVYDITHGRTDPDLWAIFKASGHRLFLEGTPGVGNAIEQYNARFTPRLALLWDTSVRRAILYPSSGGAPRRITLQLRAAPSVGWYFRMDGEEAWRTATPPCASRDAAIAYAEATL